VIELFVFARLYQGLSAVATKRGRSVGWGLLGIVGWVVGELVGFVLGSAIGLAGGAYIVALIGAIAGAFGVYQLLLALPSLAESELDIEKITDTFR
jgi:outer membrane lipoprotein SlyB